MSRNVRKSDLIAELFTNHGEFSTYPIGQTLLQYELGNQIFYIDQGFVADNLHGKKNAGAGRFILSKGDLLQTQLLLSKHRTDLIYSCLTKVDLYGLPLNYLVKKAKNSTSLTTEMLLNVLTQNEINSERIENLSYRYASDKLIYRILFLAERFGVLEDNTISIRVPVTHRNLGIFVNLARETVSREMKKLEEKRLINYDNHLITILNLRGLLESLHEKIRTDWSSVENILNK